MARCNSCSRFVSYDEPEVIVDNIELDLENEVYVDVTINLNCGECGDTLRTAKISDCKTATKHPSANEKEGHAPSLEIEADEPEPFDEYRPRKPRKDGKPVPFRYQVHYYGAEIPFTIICNDCNWKCEDTIRIEATAGEFEE